ncbi:MBL fold metallo-hydrolase [Microbacterium sp. cx-55]|uniref:MBL fold metallo-hydrolase n=1 Tax=unclassified Microbacterium TaxID=2609290 RepID=UPI001CC09D3B|nr:MULTISPECIES: MBL fold metallo-hydrolase [unclassified Microbacterium]MBZ4488449.1 MBL fold metallo-hydrolase [Microbacterium sp. cx-55]MCC4909489.1 MBL fold metallo-hydrolase [Microbacterium sp. cx-59]UGB35097.1 MBL fold metallo-hydrolase [Microbacterium sp. cx-55]
MSLEFQVFDLDFPVGSPNKSAVLVTGPNEALLVDAGFTRADGHRLVAAILDSGKTLRTVFISHADPDFYFGLEVIADAFPDAAIVATQTVIDHIRASYEGKLKAWAALGANLPTRLPEITPLEGATLSIDGGALELRGGSPVLPDRAYLWSAEHRAILGGVLLFQQEHVWTADTATPEKRAAWIDLLDEMSALEPALVIAGHRLPGAPNDTTAIDHTRDYLRNFETILEESADAAAVTAALIAAYPEAGMLIAAQIGPKVAKGEMTWG